MTENQSEKFQSGVTTGSNNCDFRALRHNLLLKLGRSMGKP